MSLLSYVNPLQGTASTKNYSNGKQHGNRRLYEILLKHARSPSLEDNRGRQGISEYLQYGFLPDNLFKQSARPGAFVHV